MKYKKKLGGSSADISQPNKLTPNTPTISGSVSGTFSSIKSAYTNIITFIKSNFIACLLVSILLLVYIGLFFTDTVSKDDFKEATIKCDKFNGTCPNNKKLVSDRECVNNECTADTCCVLDVKCDTFVDQCPAGRTRDDTKECATDTCTSNECCVKSCSDFTAARCGNDRIINLSKTCASDTCSIEECCDPRRTCLSSNENNIPYNCSTSGKYLKPSPGTIDCPASGCYEPLCCRDNPTQNPMCSSWFSSTNTCPANQTQKSADTICTGGTCSENTCCETNSANPVASTQPTPPVMCDTYTCPTGSSLISTSATTACPSGGCDSATCCQ